MILLMYVGDNFSPVVLRRKEQVDYADLMRFLVRMRGALTPPPRMDEPVTKIPLRGDRRWG